MSKCEHGLTSRECFVCASPKYGAPQEQQEPDWKALVLTHNAACDAGCDKEACGYAPYFAKSGRRCPTCPVYNKIEIGTGGQDGQG